jgi:hypothetical protein
MRIAGVYDVDPRLPSGDPFAFARDLADPNRIQYAEANIVHAGRGVGVVTPLRRKRTRWKLKESSLAHLEQPKEE